jgi:hypothetical protein
VRSEDGVGTLMGWAGGRWQKRRLAMVVQAEVVLLRALQQRHEPRPHRELATRARRRCSNSPPGGGVGEGGGDETPAAAASWLRRRPSPDRAASRASYCY